ncbi:FtsX-like permease family protein [Streptomyces sp. NPDC052101]|uniref:FtsX-like permease family protein n=1 Tax=Streptomyces sp. NPDC052101 TaxID=3155763 RepID=UPI003447E67B
MNIRIGTAHGEQIDSLSTNVVPTKAMGATVRPPALSGSLASLPENFLVIDEHAAESDDLSVGQHVVALLPTGCRVPTVIAAVVARGVHRGDTYVSSTLGDALTTSQVYVDSAVGSGRKLDSQRTAVVNRVLADSGAHVMACGAYLTAQRSHAARQTNNAAVVILGIALAYALIAVANTLTMAMAGRRREFALLELARTVRGQIMKVAAAESAVAVVVGTVLAAVATVLAAVTQHASLSRLGTAAPTVIPWTQIWGTVAICAVVAGAIQVQRAVRAR